MPAETANPGLLKMIFEQPEAYKFVTGMFVLFVLPPVINIINTSIKNKSTKAFTENINANLKQLNNDVSVVRDRINQMYSDTFDECNATQIEAVYRGRVSIDIDLLIKNTKQIIVINHIEDKDTTKRKVSNYSKTVVGNTRLVLNHFKKSGVSCGAMINETEYVDNIVNTVLLFIYNRDCNEKPYNYEVLKLNLKSLYDTFTVEYINRINSDIVI